MRILFYSPKVRKSVKSESKNAWEAKSSKLCKVTYNPIAASFGLY